MRFCSLFLGASSPVYHLMILFNFTLLLKDIIGVDADTGATPIVNSRMVALRKRIRDIQSLECPRGLFYKDIVRSSTID